MKTGSQLAIPDSRPSNSPAQWSLGIRTNRRQHWGHGPNGQRDLKFLIQSQRISFVEEQLGLAVVQRQFPFLWNPSRRVQSPLLFVFRQDSRTSSLAAPGEIFV